MTYRGLLRSVTKQIKLDNAQASADCWKRTQSLQQFACATPATRNLLGTQQKAYNLDVPAIESRLDQSIEGLSWLTDFSSYHKKVAALSNRHDDMVLMKFTSDLGKWMQALEPANRVMPPKPCANLSTIEELPKDPKQQIVDDIAKSFTLVKEISDHLMGDVYTRPPMIDVDAKVKRLHTAQEAKRQEKVEASAKSLLKEAAHIGDDIGALSEYMANLLENMHNNEQVLQLLHTEFEQIQMAKTQVNGSIGWTFPHADLIHRCEDTSHSLQNGSKLMKPGSLNWLAI